MFLISLHVEVFRLPMSYEIYVDTFQNYTILFLGDKMNGYEKRTNLKKTAIITAAQELFFKRGIHDVSIKEIAAVAHVSQVSIYNYFGDKNKLAKETFVFIIEEAMQSFMMIMNSNQSFDDKFQTIMAQKVDLVDRISHAYFDDEAWKDSELRQIFTESLKECGMQVYRNFIELGKKEGRINKTIPTEAVLSYIAMSLELFQRPEFLNTESSYKIGMMNLFLYGLMGKDKVQLQWY